VVFPADALVLAAGLGTRLQPLTSVRAKPAIPLAGEPIARRIVSWLVASGVDRATVNLHHLPHTLTAVLGDGSDLGAHIRYSWESPAILGSAGGPRQALDIVGTSPFWLINGDTLTDVNLAVMARAHAESAALVTLALIPNTEFLRYGGVRVAADGAVTGFVRRGPAASGSFHLIGVQLVSASVFETIPRGAAASSIGGVYDRLIAERPGSIRAFVTGARFWDIGTVSDYWSTSGVFAAKDCEDWDRSARVESSAHVSRSILWRGVVVGARAELDECIVTDDVVVPAGARYRRMVLLKESTGALIAAPLSAD
jgi:NDP-sugar pyrophosphorylase family protein